MFKVAKGDMAIDLNTCMRTHPVPHARLCSLANNTSRIGNSHLKQ